MQQKGSTKNVVCALGLFDVHQNKHYTKKQAHENPMKKPMTCSHCSQQFKNSHALHTHEGQMHQKDSTKNCSLRSGSFPSHSELALHLKQSNASTSSKSFTC